MIVDIFQVKYNTYKEGRTLKRFFSCILAAIIVWGSVAIAEGSDMRMNTILVDFSVRSGVPLIKKFGLFNSGLVSLRQYQQYASYMDKLRTDSLRIDLFMGSRSEPMGQMIMGSVDQLKYDFAPLDTILDTGTMYTAFSIQMAQCAIPLLPRP